MTEEDVGVVLERLLAQWRGARHPSSSELIHHIGDGLQVGLPRLPPKKADAARALLVGAKTDPSFFLSERLRQVETFARTTSAPMVWPLFEALSRLPADPRIATLATRLLVGDVEVPLTSKLTRRLLDCVETHGDDSHYRALELGFAMHLLDDGLAARTVRLLQRGLTFRIDGPELPEAERRALFGKQWELPPAPAEVNPLLAPVWTSPRELAPRQVLADLLLERGDPRGEFISLQLAGVSLKRQRALLKAHGRQWLGGLAEVVDLKSEPPRFERGFVDEVSLKAVRQAQFALASEAPEWATVRRVRRGLQRFSKVMLALEDPGLVSLTALNAAAREALPLTLRSVRVNAFPNETVDVLERLATAPRWVGLHFGVFHASRELRDELPRLCDLKGLERLRLSAGSADVMPSLMGQMGLSWLPPSVTRVELRDEQRLIILERDGKSWSLELMELGLNGPALEDWKTLLSELTWLEPTGVRLSVRAEFDEEAVKQLEHQARRFKLPVTRVELEGVPPELGW